jgi:filamentous hemagglutinin family protein
VIHKQKWGHVNDVAPQFTFLRRGAIKVLKIPEKIMKAILLSRGYAKVGLLGFTFTLTGFAQATMAQVVIDRTVPSNVTSLDNLNFTIDAGGRSGNNLFHSFSQFSVPTNGSAVFNNAPDVQHIFSRVTGGTVSNIDGLLQANGTANLFLLNPNGILFGPNARLQIGGSFLGTTATSIQFADNTEFSATNPQPLLTMSVPTGVQMGNQPALIQAQGSGYTNRGNFITRSPASPELAVQPGKTLALVGGNLDLNGFMLTAPQGQIVLGSTSAPGEVRLMANSQGFSFSYEQGQAFGDIQLAQKSLLDVSGLPAGSIHLQGRNIRLTDGSIALGQNYGDQPGGAIRLQATANIDFSGLNSDASITSGVRSESFGLGRSGDISLVSPRLSISQGARFNTVTNSIATGGNVQVTAATIELSGGSPVYPDIVTSLASISYGPGQAGDVMVKGDRLIISGGASLSSTAFSFGNTGKVTVENNSTIVTGESLFGLYSNLSTAVFAVGNAQDLTLNTAQLQILNGGSVGSSAFFIGNGGNVNINATDSILVSGESLNNKSSINSSTIRLSPQLRQLFGLPDLLTANAGNLIVNTPNLRLSDRGTVSVTGQGMGQAGIIKITAENVQLKNQGLIQAQTESGSGGNINLQVENLLLMRDRSSVTATAGGIGNGGNITIDSPIITGLENSDIVANAERGRGGNIQITTQGIIGLKFRPQVTPENDITASSQFGVNGTVQVNTIGVDPNSGLVTLPVDIVDPNQQIAQGCDANQGSSFVATGRGGVPQDPTQIIKLDRPWSDLRAIDTEDRATIFMGKGSANAQSPNPISPLIEATNWQRNSDGSVQILASVPISPTSPTNATCAMSSAK